MSVHRHDGRLMHPSMQLQGHGKGRCHTHRWQIEGDEVLCSSPVHVVASGANEGAQPCHCGIRYIEHLQPSVDLSITHHTVHCKYRPECSLGLTVPVLPVQTRFLANLPSDQTAIRFAQTQRVSVRPFRPLMSPDSGMPSVIA